MEIELTDRQREVKSVADEIAKATGHPATVRAVSERVPLSQPRIWRILKALKKKGAL